MPSRLEDKCDCPALDERTLAATNFHTSVVTDYDPDAFDAFEEAGWTTKEASRLRALGPRDIAGRSAAPDAWCARRGARLLDVAT
jgi:hypothetical protein